MPPDCATERGSTPRGSGSGHSRYRRARGSGGLARATDRILLGPLQLRAGRRSPPRECDLPRGGNRLPTLAKTEDTAPNAFNAPQSFFHPELEKAIAFEDQRHRLVFNGSWQLPWDIQLGGILTYANARPFEILMGTDWNGNGSSTQDRPNSLPTAQNIDQGTADTRPYNPQGPRLFGADGQLERNAGEGPNYFTIDLRLSRFFRFGDRSIELLGEVFNMTNRVNQSIPLTGNAAGNTRSTQYYLRRLARDEIMATSTYDPFQAQIGIRFSF